LIKFTPSISVFIPDHPLLKQFWWVLFFFFFFVVILGFELRASHFLHRHSTTWATLSASSFIILFSYMYIKYIDHIHTSIVLYFHSSLSLVPSPNSSHFTLIIHFFRSRFCIWERKGNICLPWSGLFHFALWSSVQYSFLQMT
jgi:hypothetical protein